MQTKKRKAKRKPKKRGAIRITPALEKVAAVHYFKHLAELDADVTAARNFVVVDGGTIIPRKQAEKIMKEWREARIIF